MPRLSRVQVLRVKHSRVQPLRADRRETVPRREPVRVPETVPAPSPAPLPASPQREPAPASPAPVPSIPAEPLRKSS